jgi:glutathione synthase/RimK-type ligase-like ATP-grasp enzyme
LARLNGLIVPAISFFPGDVLAGPDGPAALVARGFTFPLLLRTPGFHMGQHFIKVDSPDLLAAAASALRVAERPGAELLAIEFLDARGADGFARKYRIMMVGGELYPLHLAISPNWKIHYFSADMADRADHRAEEEKFLTDMPGVIGGKGIEALKRLQVELGLDYGGVDFGLNQQGDILLFEANATMVVEQPSDDPRWDYRRTAVDRIQTAVRNLLLKRSGHTSLVAAGSPSRLAAARVSVLS